MNSLSEIEQILDKDTANTTKEQKLVHTFIHLCCHFLPFQKVRPQ
jgi:hypothetical protein